MKIGEVEGKWAQDPTEQLPFKLGDFMGAEFVLKSKSGILVSFFQIISRI